MIPVRKVEFQAGLNLHTCVAGDAGSFTAAEDMLGAVCQVNFIHFALGKTVQRNRVHP